MYMKDIYLENRRECMQKGTAIALLSTVFFDNKVVLRIRIHMFLGLLDPDPDLLVRGMDPDPELLSKNTKKNLDFYFFVTYF
jgi:hypothetical protein